MQLKRVEIHLTRRGNRSETLPIGVLNFAMRPEFRASTMWKSLFRVFPAGLDSIIEKVRRALESRPRDVASMSDQKCAKLLSFNMSAVQSGNERHVSWELGTVLSIMLFKKLRRRLGRAAAMLYRSQTHRMMYMQPWKVSRV